jgi:hypothetical protein
MPSKNAVTYRLEKTRKGAAKRCAEGQITLAIPSPSKQPEGMSKVAQIEAELETLSQAELREIRDCLDDLIEDELEFTPEFEAAIQKSERELAAGIRPRVRQP